MAVLMMHLKEYVKGQIWILEYPVRYAGMDLFGRTTIIRLKNGELIIHDPCKINNAVKAEIDALGVVRFIIVPGSFHHLFVADFQQHYPSAETWLCPGLERKRPDLKFDGILGNKPAPGWQGTLEQILVQGTKIMWEVAFFHKPSKTLILVDLLENIGDSYQHKAGLYLQFWWRFVFRMWNRPKAAPEYQLGWGNRKVVKLILQKIINWDAERVILAHGETLESNVSQTLKTAWKKVLDS